MVFIYILKLESDKYYIGKSHKPFYRLCDHVSECGSAWTTKYRPTVIIDIFAGDHFDEDKWTLKYTSTFLAQAFYRHRGGKT